MRRRAKTAEDEPLRRWVSSVSAAALTPSSAPSPSPSMMNSARVVVELSRVRAPWRQFHRRQVTPVSSRQTISPGSACCSAGCPSATVSKGLRAVGHDQVRRSVVAVEVLAADRDEVLHRGRVVEVGQRVNAWKAIGAAP
jgi:hypothetical protein